jgi:hypothetical protein
MSEIVWEKLLEKDGFGRFIQITEEGPNTFTFSEEGAPSPPGEAGMGPRVFKTKEEARKYAEENYIPGRRTRGWTLKEQG